MILNLRKLNKKVNDKNRVQVTTSKLDRFKVQKEIVDLFSNYTNTYITDLMFSDIEKKLADILTVDGGLIPSFHIEEDNGRLEIVSNNIDTFNIIKYIYKGD